MPTLGIIKKILLLLIVMMSVIGLLYLLIFSGYFATAKIYIQYDEFQNENEKILDYFSVYKGKNLIFVETQKTIEQIEKEHPELQKIRVKKIFPNTLEITFSEFPIAANIESIESGKTIGKSIINTIGMVVYSDSENPNLPFIKIITDQSPAVTSVTQEQLDYMLNATTNFEEKFGMKVMEIQFLAHARELRFKTEKYFTIWLDMQHPYERQFLKLKKAMINVDIYKTPLEYVDLRIGGTNGEKIIFKRKK